MISLFCMFGTISLYAQEDDLGHIIQKVAQKEKLVKPEAEKTKSKKKSRFVFHDEYDLNVIGSKQKPVSPKKSESYNYDNKSRFKFKFNDGSAESNFVGKVGGRSMSGSMGGGSGRGGQR